MVFIDLLKARHFLMAYGLDMRATGVEGTTVWYIGQRGRAAGHTFADTLIAELRQRVDQESGIGMQRFGKNLLGGSFFNDLPRIHDTNPVGDVGVYAISCVTRMIVFFRLF